MSLDFKLARPFSRWRLKPEIGEPSYGYFAREVSDEGHDSLRVYANEIGLDGRDINPEQLLHSLERLPLDQMFKNRLRNATPMLGERFYSLGHERLRQKQVSFQTRRFCPKCLAEKRFHRVWWDIVNLYACPVHEVYLATEVQGQRLNWSWPHFDHSPKGYPLAKASVRPTEGISLRFHSLVVARLTSGERESGSLASYDLSDIIDAATFFSRWMQSDNPAKLLPPSAADVEYGFLILERDEADLRTQVREWLVANVSDEVRRQGFHASVPGFSNYWANRPNCRLQANIETVLFEVFAQVGTLSRKFARHRPSERGERTLLEASRALGLPPKGVSKFVRQLDLLPVAKWNGDALSFDGETFRRLKEAVDDLISSTDTWDIAGLPGHEFRVLIKAGKVQEFLGLPVDGKRGGRVSARAVTSLIQKVTGSVEREPRRGMMTFFSYAKHLGISQGDLALRIVEGSLVADAVDPARPGFRSMYFNVSEEGEDAQHDAEMADTGHDKADLATLWECFRSRLNAVCPAFKVPDEPSPEFQIFTSNRKLALKVTTEASAFSLVLTLHPELTRRRWERYQGDKEELHRIAVEGCWTPTQDSKGLDITLNVTARHQAREMVTVLNGLQLLLA
ncbi:Hypothetical protein RG1141_CH14880 [Neorhizobium galegae bv. officinalis bv. officinalis str. HAMBI 1141]|uniref:TniQ domain-containing protein n=1 Tax=Neorhizobium galegae bv. officinalis bv. officinalis str. HAMBI 1141 TaxID=1028801 RepID=A0A068T727_NEOGA|nr:TniQ family protein [Neorhizobium galegae]CDN53831.1 Hypothetical protein RG1141_CH14880 [Neorhizobium galegae bv. officinalis bv. officinalis str. HAMBI 1141]